MKVLSWFRERGEGAVEYYLCGTIELKSERVWYSTVYVLVPAHAGYVRSCLSIQPQV